MWGIEIRLVLRRIKIRRLDFLNSDRGHLDVGLKARLGGFARIWFTFSALLILGVGCGAAVGLVVTVCICMYIAQGRAKSNIISYRSKYRDILLASRQKFLSLNLLLFCCNIRQNMALEADLSLLKNTPGLINSSSI